MKDFKYELGSVVKDRITGFKGVIIVRSQWITNCNTYGIKPQTLKDGIPQDYQQIDEPNLILIKEDVFSEPKDKTGGPTDRIKATNR